MPKKYKHLFKIIIRYTFKKIQTKMNILKIIVWPLIKLLSIFFQFLFFSRIGRYFFFKAFPKNSLAVVSCRKLSQELYVVNTSDEIIGLNTFVRLEAFDSLKLKKVLSLLPYSHSRKTIVDIGANIGTISIHAVANNFFESAIAFEPEPKNFLLLKANVALNNLEKNFSLHNIALSDDKNNSLKFELSENNYGDHRVRVTRDEGLFQENSRQVISVPSDTLNNYSQKLSKDNTLIWIDTQGYEGHVFSGANLLISRQIPICMEFWPYGLKRAGGYDKLINVFSSAPYKKIIDLNNPDYELKFNIKNLEKIAKNIGSKGNYTDLLIL